MYQCNVDVVLMLVGKVSKLTMLIMQSLRGPESEDTNIQGSVEVSLLAESKSGCFGSNECPENGTQNDEIKKTRKCEFISKTFDECIYVPKKLAMSLKLFFKVKIIRFFMLQQQFDICHPF